MVENNGAFEWSDISKLALMDKPKGSGVFTVSPNPSTTYLNLDLNELSSSDARVEILDIYGKCIMRADQPEIISDNVVRLDISSLSNGMYFIRLMNESGNEANSVKFVKL